MNSSNARFTELVDRYGADLTAWPTAEAAWARRELLANPATRVVQDEALQLEGALWDYGQQLDRHAGSASIERVTAGVLARLPARRVSEMSWWLPRIAAGFVLAMVAGGVFDMYVTNPGGDGVELATLDTLIYGPGELDL